MTIEFFDNPLWYGCPIPHYSETGIFPPRLYIKPFVKEALRRYSKSIPLDPNKLEKCKQIVASCKPCFQCVSLEKKLSCRCGLIQYCSSKCRKAAHKVHKTWCIDQSKQNLSYYLEPPKKGLPPALAAAACRAWQYLPQFVHEHFDKELPTSKGPISPQEVQHMCVLKTTGPIPIKWVDALGNIRRMTQEEFFNEFGTYFSKRALYQPHELVQHLQTLPKQPEERELQWPRDKLTMQRILNNPFKVRLEKEDDDWGVRVYEPIPSGYPIFFVGGAHQANQWAQKRGSYLLLKNKHTKLWIHSQTPSIGLGGFVQHGAPNCYFLSMHHKSPFNSGKVVIAGRNIAAGEFLHADFIDELHNESFPMSTMKCSIKPYLLREFEKYFSDRATFYSTLERIIKGDASVAEEPLRVIEENLLGIFFLASHRPFAELHIRGLLDPVESINFFQRPDMREPYHAFCHDEYFLHIPMLRNILRLGDDEPLRHAFLTQTEPMTDECMLQLLKDQNNPYPLTSETLPQFITFGKLLNDLFLTMYYYPWDKTPAEIEHDESILLLTSACLPNELKQGTVLTYLILYLKERNPAQEPEGKYAYIERLTLEMIKLDMPAGEDAMRVLERLRR